MPSTSTSTSASASASTTTSKAIPALPSATSVPKPSTPAAFVAMLSVIPGTVSIEGLRVPSAAVAVLIREFLELFAESSRDFIGGINVVEEACQRSFDESIAAGKTAAEAWTAYQIIETRTQRWTSLVYTGLLWNIVQNEQYGTLHNLGLYILYALACEAIDVLTLALRSLRARLQKGDPHIIYVQNALLTMKSFVESRCPNGPHPAPPSLAPAAPTDPLPTDGRTPMRLPQCVLDVLEQRLASYVPSARSGQVTDPNEIIPRFGGTDDLRCLPTLTEVVTWGEELFHGDGAVANPDSDEDIVDWFSWLVHWMCLYGRLSIRKSKFMASQNDMGLLGRMFGFIWPRVRAVVENGDDKDLPREALAEILCAYGIIVRHMKDGKDIFGRWGGEGMLKARAAFSKASQLDCLPAYSYLALTYERNEASIILTRLQAGVHKGDLVSIAHIAQAHFWGRYGLVADHNAALSLLQPHVASVSIHSFQLPGIFGRLLKIANDMKRDVSKFIPSGSNVATEHRRLLRMGASYGDPDAIHELEKIGDEDDGHLVRYYLGQPYNGVNGDVEMKSSLPSLGHYRHFAAEPNKEDDGTKPEYYGELVNYFVFPQ